MNAREMFEECGYIKTENAYTIEYSHSDEDYIYFYKGKKIICKQAKELGWLSVTI